MRPTGTFIRRGEIEFYLKLHGLWEGIIPISSPPDQPYDIETMEPIRDPAPYWWTCQEMGRQHWTSPSAYQ